MPLKAQRGGGGIALSMCNFGTTWEWVANAKFQSLYSPRSDPVHIVRYKRLSGPHDRSWRERLRANLLHPLGFEHRTVQPVVSRDPSSTVVIVRDNYHKWSSVEGVSNDTNITTYISIKIYSLQVRADYIRLKQEIQRDVTAVRNKCCY